MDVRQDDGVHDLARSPKDNDRPVALPSRFGHVWVQFGAHFSGDVCDTRSHRAFWREQAQGVGPCRGHESADAATGLRTGQAASAAAFEAHHVLDDTFAGLGNLGRFARSVSTILAKLLLSALNLHREQFVDVVFALSAHGHGRRITPLAPGIEPIVPQAAGVVIL